jgi:hypothetical protein
MGKMLVSVFAGKANHYIREEKPSELIPFKGEFPLLPEYRSSDYNEIIFNTEYLEDCPEWAQKIILNGERIYEIENGFKDYLNTNHIPIEKFMKMKSSDKATELIRFFNANSLTFDSLKIN